MFVDFHTHLHSYADGEGLVECINANKIISVGCSVDIGSYLKTKELADRSAYIIPSFGIHPMNAATLDNLAALDPYMAESKMIGEIGLDYHWFPDVARGAQETVFEYFLDHCHKTKKYCVIHTKGAEETVLAMLGNFPDARPIIHWYSGPQGVFRNLIERNCHFTFGCEVFYSDHIRSLLAETPTELLLSETDNPTSEIWLGGTSESPLLIQRVLRDMASVKNIDTASMERIVFDTSMKILNSL